MNHFGVIFSSIALTLAVTPALVAPVANAQEDPAAAEWCASHKGIVVNRYPASNASSETPVAMGPAVRFCEFTGGEGADLSNSRISIRLTTLVSDQPSMVVVAYLTKPEMATSDGSANPASVYCSDLGGVEIGGPLAPDGGWVNSEDTTDVAEMCVFPDLSIINSWALAYHTMGTIRGADLAPLFQWKPIGDS